MRGRRSLGTLCAVLVSLFFVMVEPSAALSPIQPSEGFGLQHLALYGLESSLRSGDIYAETVQKDRFFTKDQMMGILAAIGARAARPDQADFWRERAISMWKASEAAFVDQAFYARTLPAASGVLCIDVETNSWALRAAHALSASTTGLVPDPGERATDLRALLSSFLSGTVAAGKPSCPSEPGPLPLHLRPPLYLAMLETRGQGSDLDGSLRSAIQNTISSWFDDAFALADGLYLASLNAQMLCVLVEASKVFDDPNFRQTRDDLAAWIQTESISRDAFGATIMNMERASDRFEANSPAGPDGQMWAAYALANLARENRSGVEPTIVNDLLSSFGARFWLPGANGFADGTIVYADYNLLPAALGGASPASLTALDPSAVGFVVLSRSSFQYPLPHEPAASNLYILNDWAARFSLPGDGGASVDLVLPAQSIAPFNFSMPESAFFPPPTVVRTGSNTGSSVTVRDFHGDSDMLWIQAQPRGTGTFRLDAYVPVRPTFSDFGSSIRILLENRATEPIELGTLQLEMEAIGVRIRDVTLDNVPIPGVEVVDPVITEQLPEPHMRILLSDVTLPPGQSELVLTYTDITRPEVGTPAITRDLEGRDVIAADKGGPIQVLQGETAFVRATVRDNGALRSVQLRYRTLDQSLDLRMSPVDGQKDVYAVQLPTHTIPTGEGVIQVVAIDAAGTGNLNQSAPVQIDLRDPLFAGSVVLFVFSGTLFLAAFIIWLKVRRKELH